MFWKRGTPEKPSEEPEREFARAAEPAHEPFEIESGAPRPATVIRVAAELERRGKKVVELFKEIETPHGRVILPIYVREGDDDLFAEVETGPWDGPAIERITRIAALLRSSGYRDARLELFSAHPVPEPTAFLLDRSPAALLQLHLIHANPKDPESFAETFREAACRCWEVDLDYTVESLPLTEELLAATLDGGENGGRTVPVLDALVRGLGSYLGEVVRRNAPQRGAWCTADDWGEYSVLEVHGFSLDPIGKSRAFLDEGRDDSIAYYARYVLRELGGEPPAEPEAGERRDQA